MNSFIALLTTFQLFFHYLEGSGTTVVLNDSSLRAICLDPQSYPSPLGHKGIVSTYGTPYGNAIGDFHCEGKVGIDYYDFKYAGDPRYCKSIKKPPKKASMLSYYIPDVGRCIVGLHKGGKPFKVIIK